jgi:hypothetical protein
VRVVGGIHRRAALWPAVALAGLAGCGQESQDVNEPAGTFPVEVVRADFPTSQRLAQRSTMEIAVRNAGAETVPNVAVTVEPVQPGAPAKADAFEEASDQPGLANPSRPVWIVDSGPAGGVTAYSNTWALGRLRPGQVKTFVWRVTAVKPGTHTVKYTVAAGLDGKAKARLASGELATGSFQVDISGTPADARVGAGDQPQTLPR